MAAAKDGGARRSWSLENVSALLVKRWSPGVCCGGCGRHGLNANLVFKWIRRAARGLA